MRDGSARRARLVRFTVSSSSETAKLETWKTQLSKVACRRVSDEDPRGEPQELRDDEHGTGVHSAGPLREALNERAPLVKLALDAVDGLHVSCWSGHVPGG
jgi:hypothetical protein